MNSTRMKPQYLVIIGGLFCVPTLMFLCIYLYQSHFYRERSQGTIVEAGYDTDGTWKHGNPAVNHIPVAQVEFDTSDGRRISKQFMAAKIPVSGPITVWYNPTRPTDATIAPLTVWQIIVSSPLVLIGAFILRLGLQRDNATVS